MDDIKQKIIDIADKYPELLGFRGKLTYMFCEVIPENADLTDKTTMDLMDWIPGEHLNDIYNRLVSDGYIFQEEEPFKDKFKRLRKQMGMTQAQLSKFYGISRRNIENWESGLNEPTAWVEKLLLADMKNHIKNGTE